MIRKRNRGFKRLAGIILCAALVFESAAPYVNAGENTAVVETAQTQSQTEAQTKEQTEAQTQSQTEAQTQSQTEAQTQSQTEAQTQGQTEPQTQGQTEAQTQAQTEAQTQGQTEAQTQVQTEAQTEPQTQGQTDGEALPEIDIQIEAETQMEEESQTQSQTEEETGEMTETGFQFDAKKNIRYLLAGVKPQDEELWNTMKLDFVLTDLEEGQTVKAGDQFEFKLPRDFLYAENTGGGYFPRTQEIEKMQEIKMHPFVQRK